MEWKAAWSYLPIDFNYTLGEIENITQRAIFKNNIDGEKIRLKFSNKYGKEPIYIEKALLTQKRKNESQIEESCTLTKEHKSQIYIAPGEEFYSDEIEYNTEAGSELIVSIYFKEKIKIQSICATWCAKSWNTQYLEDGDYTNNLKTQGKQGVDVLTNLQTDENIPTVLIGISKIEVLTAKKVKTITMFGDSITHMSYYFDAFLQKIYAAYPGEVTLINRGIGGNRLLYDASYNKDDLGKGKCFGTSGVSRFEEDVFLEDSPEMVFLLEGVNDIMHPDVFSLPKEVVNAEMLEQGIRAVTQICRQHKSKIFLGTIMPFGAYPIQVGEDAKKIRNEVNAWVRTQTIADGYFDFSKEIESSAKAGYMKEEYHLGDGLHPNVMGGEKMADLVLKSIF